MCVQSMAMPDALSTAQGVAKTASEVGGITYNLLTESGDNLVTESGDHIVTEAHP